MVKTKRKSIISKSKSSSKPKLKQNERKLSAKDQNALAKISSKEKHGRSTEENTQLSSGMIDTQIWQRSTATS